MGRSPADVSLTLRVTMDWADDGLVFVPCAAHVEPILFRVEPPHSPIVMYAARGTAALSDLPRPVANTNLGDLIGDTASSSSDTWTLLTPRRRSHK
jgi:hypothetical protein